MKVSREQMIENRSRILDAASALFREKGFDAVTVAEVMKAAGFSHGGFYGHFTSKDDLVAQTLKHSMSSGSGDSFNLEAYIGDYLSARHRDNPGKGCPTAGLASDIRHQKPEARAALTEGLKRHIDKLGRALSPESGKVDRRAAIHTWAAMVGAVILARAVDDQALADEILDETRRSITDM